MMMFFCAAPAGFWLRLSPLSARLASSPKKHYLLSARREFFSLLVFGLWVIFSRPFSFLLSSAFLCYTSQAFFNLRFVKIPLFSLERAV